MTEEEPPKPIPKPEPPKVDPFPLIKDAWIAEEMVPPPNTIKFAPKKTSFNEELFESAW